MSDVREGLLAGGLPYRAAGAGSVVVVFGGIEADNADPANPTAGSLPVSRPRRATPVLPGRC